MLAYVLGRVDNAQGVGQPDVSGLRQRSSYGILSQVCTNNADFSTASPTGTDTPEHRTVIISEAKNHHCKIRSGRLEWKGPNVAAQPICPLLAATVETALL